MENFKINFLNKYDNNKKEEQVITDLTQNDRKFFTRNSINPSLLELAVSNTKINNRNLVQSENKDTDLGKSKSDLDHKTLLLESFKN